MTVSGSTMTRTSAPAGPATAKGYPEESVQPVQHWSRSFALEHGDLLSEGEDLESRIGSTLEEDTANASVERMNSGTKFPLLTRRNALRHWCPSPDGLDEHIILTLNREVGHLLLGPAPHAHFGIMRGQWAAEDLRRTPADRSQALSDKRPCAGCAIRRHRLPSSSRRPPGLPVGGHLKATSGRIVGVQPRQSLRC